MGASLLVRSGRGQLRGLAGGTAGPFALREGCQGPAPVSASRPMGSAPRRSGVGVALALSRCGMNYLDRFI